MSLEIPLNIVGALLPTFAISRILLLLMYRWKGGVTRIAFANLVSWLAYVLLVPFLFYDERLAISDFVRGWEYLPAQLIWFAVDLVLLRRRTHSSN